MFIDCNLFLPFIALDVDLFLDEREIRNAIKTNLENLVKQGIGRILRSRDESKYSTMGTTFDDTQKVIILYNVPNEIIDISVSKNIRNEEKYLEVIETWLAEKSTCKIESIVDSVIRAVESKPIQNWLEMERERIKAAADEKYTTGGIENLSHKQRAVLDKDTIEQTKQAEKLETHKQKITELKKSNPKIQWRDIYVRLNLSREDANHRDQLRDFFIKLSLNN